MKIRVEDGPVRRDIDHLKKRLVPAAEEAAAAATKEFGQRLLKRVQDMIPNKGGWYDIYKGSIKLFELENGMWELTTVISEIVPASIPADTSIITLSPKQSADARLSNAATLIASEGDGQWTLDTIPAIKGGIPADMVLKAASVGEVEYFRRKRLADRPNLDHRLKALNVQVLEFDPTLPLINGRVLADVPFLALRLEYGYGGFPRTPIWSRIDMEGEIISKSKAVKQAGYGTFAERWRQKK